MTKAYKAGKGCKRAAPVAPKGAAVTTHQHHTVQGGEARARFVVIEHGHTTTAQLRANALAEFATPADSSCCTRTAFEVAASLVQRA